MKEKRKDILTASSIVGRLLVPAMLLILCGCISSPQEFTNLAPGKWYSIREDSAKAVVMDTKPFRFAKSTDVTVTE